jgi:hypothetical protein
MHPAIFKAADDPMSAERHAITETMPTVFTARIIFKTCGPINERRPGRLQRIAPKPLAWRKRKITYWLITTLQSDIPLAVGMTWDGLYEDLRYSLERTR